MDYQAVHKFFKGKMSSRNFQEIIKLYVLTLFDIG